MVKVTKIVAVGLAGIGVVELALRGTDASLYAWYLLLVLWVILLLIRSTTTSGTGSQEGAGDLFDDFRVNPILREDDPFGEFFDS